MIYVFDDFTFDLDKRELRAGQRVIELQPQVFDVLQFLLANNDRVVGKDELLAAVWHGRIVSESTLASRINAARNAIGDNGDDQRLIRTVLRKGFRFVGAKYSRPTPRAPAPAMIRLAVRLPSRRPCPNKP